MGVAVPNNLEGDYVVVGYVDNDAQQPDLKTSCGRVLPELLGNSDSLTRPYMILCLHNFIVKLLQRCLL